MHMPANLGFFATIATEGERGEGQGEKREREGVTDRHRGRQRKRKGVIDRQA